VHKDSITSRAARRREGTTRLDRLPNDLPKLKKWWSALAERARFGRVTKRAARVRPPPRAPGVGLCLRRDCAVAHPKRPGVQRKHDKRDAVDLARLNRAGELVAYAFE